MLRSEPYWCYSVLKSYTLEVHSSPNILHPLVGKNLICLYVFLLLGSLNFKTCNGTIAACHINQWLPTGMLFAIMRVLARRAINTATSSNV